MAIFRAGRSGKRIRQATDADVETSTHQTASLDKVAVSDELETDFKCVINTHPKVNSVGNPCEMKCRKRRNHKPRNLIVPRCISEMLCQAQNPLNPHV